MFIYLGKTAAFVLPILERLLWRDLRLPAIRVLILAPTRYAISHNYMSYQYSTNITYVVSWLFNVTPLLKTWQNTPILEPH